MAKGDVVGVAAFPDDEGPHVVRLMLDDGKGGETRGDQVVWVPANPDPRRPWLAVGDDPAGSWHAVKPEGEVTDEDRKLHKARPVPGERLKRQPPQVPVKLPQEIVNRGVAAKAASAVTNGHPETAAHYLTNRVEVGLIDRETAEAIAQALDVKLERKALEAADKARGAIVAAQEG